MAKVFLSYDHQDAARARPIAQALEKAGHEVWWDRHIRGGAQYSKEIERALNDAQAVVVLWSERSVESPWVRDEAAAGRDSGRLVPVTLDGTEPPLGFRQYQTMDLSRRSRNSVQLRDLSAAIEAHSAPGADPSPLQPSRVRGDVPKRKLWFAAAALLALSGAGFAAWRLLQPGNTGPIVAVAAADRSSRSIDLADDLVVKLGNLQSSRPDAIHLLAQADSDERATLLFRVAAEQDNDTAAANLMLLDGTSQSLMWSKTFEPPTAQVQDLKQQLGYAAAKVLSCAQDALSLRGRRLDPQTFRLYLNGCAMQAETVDLDAPNLVRVFREVTVRAPWFEQGWAKLLLTESRVLGRSIAPEPSGLREQVIKDIQSARKVRSDMAEAAIAEARLLPPTAFFEREQMIERALAANPDSAELLAMRAQLLGTVGRMNAAVQNARRASELDPLSPVHQHAYLSALAYAGRSQAAFDELRAAERLWPGASTTVDARLRLHLRFGDPREALRLSRTGATTLPAMAEVLLLAKTDPTAANVERARALVRSLLRRTESTAVGAAIQGHADFGIADELYALADRWAVHNPDITALVFRPAFRLFRHDPRFMAAMRRTGHLNYWRRSGHWPDFCSEPDLPYDCKREAARLATQ